LCEVHVVIARI